MTTLCVPFAFSPRKFPTPSSRDAPHLSKRRSPKKKSDKAPPPMAKPSSMSTPAPTKLTKSRKAISSSPDRKASTPHPKSHPTPRPTLRMTRRSRRLLPPRNPLLRRLPRQKKLRNSRARPTHDNETRRSTQPSEHPRPTRQGTPRAHWRRLRRLPLCACRSQWRHRNGHQCSAQKRPGRRRQKSPARSLRRTDRPLRSRRQQDRRDGRSELRIRFRRAHRGISEA